MAQFSTRDAENDQIASSILDKIQHSKSSTSPAAQWMEAIKHLSPKTPFEIHSKVFDKIYGDCAVKPCWFPSEQSIAQTNIKKLMDRKGFTTYEEFYKWSVGEDTREEFWLLCIEAIDIKWHKQPSKVFDLSKGGPAHVSVRVPSPFLTLFLPSSFLPQPILLFILPNPIPLFIPSLPYPSLQYFPDGQLNAAESCFTKRSGSEPALIYAMDGEPREIQTMSFSVLDRLSNQIANAIQQKLKLSKGDAVAVCMPMTPEVL